MRDRSSTSLIKRSSAWPGCAGFQEAPLLGRRGRAPRQFGQAEHAIERGADLVAHVGKEATLGQVGVLGFMLSGLGLCQRDLQSGGANAHQLFQLLMAALAIELLVLERLHFGHDAGHPRCAAAFVGKGLAASAHPTPLARCVEIADLVREATQAGRRQSLSRLGYRRSTRL